MSPSVNGVSNACPTMCGPPCLARAGRPPPRSRRPRSSHTPRVAPVCLRAPRRCRRPTAARPAVIHRGGESVLGRVAVVRRDNDRVAAHAQITAQRIVRNGVAEQPNRRRGSTRRSGGGPASAAGRADTPGRLPRRAGRRRRSRRRRGRAVESPTTPCERAGFGDRHRFHRWQVHRCHLVQHHLDVGLQSADHTVVALRPVGPDSLNPRYSRATTSSQAAR